MKLVKGLVCILFSLIVLMLGVGYAQSTDEITATGKVNFTHTDLYISNIDTQGSVNILGCSDTTVSLTAVKDSVMIVSITNPTVDTHYYVNYTAGSYTLNISDDDLKLGSSVAPGKTITFTVKLPAIASAQAIKFNFSLVPPTFEEPGTDTDKVTTNATAIIEFVLNDTKHGLNLDKLKHTFEEWCTSTTRVLFCRDNGVTGGNLNKDYGSLNAENVYYTLEWVSSTKYNIYLYHSVQAEANLGKYIVVYKQEIIYNSIDKKWSTGDSFKGYGKIQTDVKGNGIEHKINENGIEYVVWYANKDDVPVGGVIVE